MATRQATMRISIALAIMGCDRSVPPAERTTQISQDSASSQPSAPNTVSAPKQTPVKESGTVESDESLTGDLSTIFALIKQRQNGAARVRLYNYLKLHPDDGKAEFLFGLSYHREQKYGQAMPYFDKALAHAPSYLPINHFRGWALYNMGELDASRAAFESFLTLKPGEPDSNFALGLIELDEHNLEEAKGRFEKSIALLVARGDDADPKALSKAHTRLGEVFDQQGDFATAKHHYELAVKLYPDHYEALYKLYRVHVRLGETEEADRVHALYVATKERVRPGTSFPE